MDDPREARRKLSLKVVVAVIVTLYVAVGALSLITLLLLRQLGD